MRSRLAVLVLLFSAAFAARAALVAGPERPVSPVTYAAAAHEQYLGDLATNGSEFLLVWQEAYGQTAGLFAVAIDAQGIVRPFAPRPIVECCVNDIQVVWTGDAYLAVWWTGQDTMAARFSRDATLLSGPTLVTHADFLGGLDWNGERALFLASDFELGKTMAFTVDASGAQVRPPVALGVMSVKANVTATAGGAFLATWVEVVYEQVSDSMSQGYSTVRSVRVSAAGDVSAPVTLANRLPSHIDRISGAAIGNQVGLAFDGEYPLKVRRYTIDVPALTVTAHPVIERNDNVYDDPEVVVTPDGFAASFLRFDGTLLLSTYPFAGTTPRSIELGSAFAEIALVASTGQRAIAVWRGGQTLGALFDTPLARRVSDVMPVAISAVAQRNPAIAAAGKTAMVAWLEETTRFTADVVVRRFDDSGRPIDAQPILVGTNADIGARPAVVFTGQAWLVAWQSDQNVEVRRVTGDGTLQVGAPLSIEQAAQPVLAANGDVAVLAFSGASPFGPPNGISYVRFSPHGERIDADPIVAYEAGYQPAIATNGPEFLLVWTAGGDRAPNRWGIFGKRLSTGGALMDAAPIVIADSEGSEGTPRVASDGSNFLVVYEKYERGPQSFTARAKQVLRNGTLGDSTGEQDGHLIVGAALPGSSPDVVGRDRGYVVSIHRYGVPHELLLQPVDSRGIAVEAPTLVAQGLSFWYAIGGNADELWLSYSRSAPELRHVNRLLIRTLTEPSGSRRRSVRR